ncbi:hypothetical protein HPB50_022672 [Hyalomma asiaticum]|uniref:Uncharacterized protein n=1 Tax=Hyalomma asiaticum TaxID=266040 RepID=A0ACB7T1R3_HYAAI|nr:hypothetical protein HPB50_022672 [Hyalomma asiaticum]
MRRKDQATCPPASISSSIASEPMETGSLDSGEQSPLTPQAFRTNTRPGSVRLLAKRLRRCFTTEEDLAILREVAATKPFGDDLKWVEVIANLKRVLGRELTLRSLKDRVDLLIGYWRREDTRNLGKSGTEEQYAEKEQILQDLSDYVRSINYVPKVAPRSLGSSGRNRSQPAASSLSTPPEKVRADEVLPGIRGLQSMGLQLLTMRETHQFDL